MEIFLPQLDQWIWWKMSSPLLWDCRCGRTTVAWNERSWTFASLAEAALWTRSSQRGNWKKMQEETLESQKIKIKTQIIQTRPRIFTVNCIAYFYTGVIFGCKPWVIIKFESNPCHPIICAWVSLGRKKTDLEFGIVYCFYQTFKDWSPWKCGWLTRRAWMWLNLYDCQAVLKKVTSELKML